MSANSPARRFVKRLLAPLLNESTYRVTQSWVKAWDIRNGTWTEPEIALLEMVVRPGEVAIDIGANYGLYCYHLSKRVGAQGKVHAFEPVPFTYGASQLVGKLLRFNHNVELYNKGCGDQAGAVSFTLPVQTSGAISAGIAHITGEDESPPPQDVLAPYEETTEVTCEVVVLDKFLGEIPGLTFIKCDVEGADLLALRGASRLIEATFPTILCEMEPWYMKRYGIEPADMGAFFSHRGYDMYHLDIIEGHRSLTPVTPEQLGSFSTQNYLLVHPRRLNRVASLMRDTGSVSPRFKTPEPGSG